MFQIIQLNISSTHVIVSLPVIEAWLYLSTVRSASDCRFEGHKFNSQLGHITSMENDHEMLSTVILSQVAQIQEGQLPVTGKSM